LRQRLRVALLIAMILVPRPNIARALVANGGAARVVLLSGGAEGAQPADLLSSLGIKVVNVPVLGAVGANVSIVKPDGTVTKINEPGPGRWVDLEPKALGSFSLKTDPWVRVENPSISLNSGFFPPRSRRRSSTRSR
jgi:hypothetical protein